MKINIENLGKNTIKQMHNYKVSIIMSTFNDANFIKQSINSVINQSYRNWEFIIINDASTDESDRLIKEYAFKDKRIVYIINDHTQGLIKNLNTGISISSGELISRIDSDDQWIDSDKIKKQVEFLNSNPDYSLVGTFAKAIDSKDNFLFNISFPNTDQDIRRQMLNRNCFTHSSVIIRKKELIKVGMYNPSHEHIEDFGLWLALGTISKLYNIPEYMVAYRIHSKSITYNSYKEQMSTFLKVIHSYKNFYPNYYLYFLIGYIRMHYPGWLKGNLSFKLKNFFKH